MMTERKRTKTYYDLKAARTELNRFLKNKDTFIARWKSNGPAMWQQNVDQIRERIARLEAEWEVLNVA